MLALIQVVAPLGVLIGYIVTATLNMNLNSLPYFGDIKKDERWLYSFYIQSILIWGLSLCLLFFSNNYFNSKARRVPIEIEKSLNKNEKNTIFLRQSFFYDGNISFLDKKDDEKALENKNQNYEKENSVDNDSKKDKAINDIKSDNNSSKCINIEKKLKNKIKEISFCRKVKLIFSEPLFIFCVLTMSMLYFIVTFIQYWASDYMLIALDIQDEKQRLFAFSLVCLSSPTLGLVIGGLIVDRLGGYSRKSSVIFCLISSLLCIIPAILIPFVDSLINYVCLLWVLLFFGAALIPPTQGIIIACLPKDIQGSGNSFSIFFFNLLGYFPAPFVYGFLKDYFNDIKDPKKGSRMAHKYTLWGVMGISVISIIITTFIRLVKDKEYTEKMGRDKSKINSEVLNNNEKNNEKQNDNVLKDMSSFNDDNEECINKNKCAAKKE
jgi:MFS family permease